jgi:flagellin FlaB
MKHMHRKKDIGAIGIGTLIIFIALILVAAIAAAVIIKTAEELEEKAKAAGDDAQKMVRASPMIMIAEGTVTSGNINQIALYIDLYGSEGVDMRDLVLHIVANPQTGNGVSTDLTFNTATPTTANADNFGTDEILDPLNQYDPTATPPRYILGERARLVLTVSLTQALVNLPPSSTLEIFSHVTTSGNERYDYFRTPSAYPNGGVVTLGA